MEVKMEVKTVRATIDKATGQVLKEQVLAVNEIDETTYYRPLVEIFGKRILEEMQNSKKMR